MTHAAGGGLGPNLGLKGCGCCAIAAMADLFSSTSLCYLLCGMRVWRPGLPLIYRSLPLGRASGEDRMRGGYWPGL
jgi:hypothetical protein